MVLILLLCIFLVSALILQLSNFRRRLTNFPPGPFALPFFGNVFTIGDDPHISFLQMSKNYGPIVGFMWGRIPGIAVHGTKLIKEIFSSPSFAGRGENECMEFLSGGEDGIVQGVGEAWVEQRRFALRHLRDFGFGKSSMEELILEETKEFGDWLKKSEGKPVELQKRFSLAVVNSLWKITTGERFDHDDKQLYQIIHDLERSMNAVLGSGFKAIFIFFYPAIAKAFPNWSRWNELIECSKPRREMFNRIIQEHLSTLPEDHSRDFVDVYLQEVQKTRNPNSSFRSETGIKALSSVLADFFIAGTDTTAVTLSWLNLYLLHNPQVQAKLHEELDRVIGRSRAPSLSDRKNLPFTEAVLLETLRLSSIAPIAIPHSATEDCKFHGYDIPKGTIVFANLYANHLDPQIWGDDVEEFRPERFLSPDGQTVQRHEALMPFSTGRRVCLGETLARDSLFLFATYLALNFEVTKAEGMEIPPLEATQGHVTLAPKSSIVAMKERSLI